MPAADRLTEAPLIPLPPEAGDVNAPRFDPNEAWLLRATPDQQKAAMWRWFATRYQSPEDPETAAPHTDEPLFHPDEVLHGRFDPCVPPAVVDELARRVGEQVGNDWARRGLDEFGG